jgi:hypothetical protein
VVTPLALPETEVKAMSVKIADGSVMQSKTEVTAVSWWCQENTFSHNLRVLPIGGYDGVLGMDWLELHNPMVCDWVGKKLAFEEA